MVNRLSDSDSEYLRQHAHQQVDWWEWGDEALAAALEVADATPSVTAEVESIPGGEAGAGTGLRTLRGRLAVLGGELDARASRGRFELCARLPWEATA